MTNTITSVEEVEEAVATTPRALFCNEGPPQIVPVMGVTGAPNLVVSAAPTNPPMQFQLAPVRPNRAVGDKACGRFVLKEDATSSDLICGNCVFAVEA